MSNRRHLIIGSIIFIVLLFLFVWPYKVLVVQSPNMHMQFSPQSFTIGWIHSVEKEPWYELYKPREDGFLLYETYFKTFGAGVPSDGEIIPSTDGFVHMKIENYYEELSIASSTLVETTLYIGDRAYPLYSEERQSINIYIESIPFIKFIMRGLFK